MSGSCAAYDAEFFVDGFPEHSFDDFGYAVAHYADFYDIRQILALGRVTSGAGGDLLLREAKRVLETEFPTEAG